MNNNQNQQVKELTTERTKRDEYQERAFHKFWLKFIKNKLGRKCSFLSFVKSNDGNFGLKAVINNKTSYIHLEGSPQDITDSSYRDLLEQLSNVK